MRLSTLKWIQQIIKEVSFHKIIREDTYPDIGEALLQMMKYAIASGIWEMNRLLTAVSRSPVRRFAEFDFKGPLEDALQSFVSGGPEQEWHHIVPEEGLKWMESYTYQLKGILAPQMLDAIKDTIKEGIGTADKPGLSEDEVRAKLSVLLPHIAEYRIQAIARTESMRCYNLGQLSQLKAADATVEGVEFCAILDSRTTDICAERDGLVLRIDDPRLWENTPPLHPNCRSILIPVMYVEEKSNDYFDTDADKFDVLAESEPPILRDYDKKAVEDIVTAFIPHKATLDVKVQQKVSKADEAKKIQAAKEIAKEEALQKKIAEQEQAAIDSYKASLKADNENAEAAQQAKEKAEHEAMIAQMKADLAATKAAIAKEQEELAQKKAEEALTPLQKSEKDLAKAQQKLEIAEKELETFLNSLMGGKISSAQESLDSFKYHAAVSSAKEKVSQAHKLFQEEKEKEASLLSVKKEGLVSALTPKDIFDKYHHELLEAEKALQAFLDTLEPAQHLTAIQSMYNQQLIEAVKSAEKKAADAYDIYKQSKTKATEKSGEGTVEKGKEEKKEVVYTTLPKDIKQVGPVDPKGRWDEAFLQDINLSSQDKEVLTKDPAFYSDFGWKSNSELKSDWDLQRKYYQKENPNLGQGEMWEKLLKARMDAAVEKGLVPASEATPEKIREMARGIRDYTSSGYQNTRSWQMRQDGKHWDGRSFNEDVVSRQVKYIENFILSSPRPNLEDSGLYRGQHSMPDYLRGRKVGDEVYSSAFISTTDQVRVAENFGGRGDVFITFENPKAMRSAGVDTWSTHMGEAEYITSSANVYEIVSIDESGGNTKFVLRCVGFREPTAFQEKREKRY